MDGLEEKAKAKIKNKDIGKGYKKIIIKEIKFLVIFSFC